MPAKSDNQRQLFCIALSIKQGKTDPGYSKQAAQMAEEMDEATLNDYCTGKVAAPAGEE
jgi:hypothetical protein